MKFRPKTWVMVLTGALMTIISALLVHYVVSANMREVTRLGNEKQFLQSSIESFWKNSNRVEANFHTALIVLANSNLVTREEARNIAREMLQSSGKEYKVKNSAITPEFVIKQSKAHRRDIIGKIDDLYIEQLSISDKIMIIEEKNAFYTNLALFFQVFGLVLVLSKDLWRKIENN